MGSEILTYAQWGLESTRGTAVASTRIVGFDQGPVPNDRTVAMVKLANANRSQANKVRSDTLQVVDERTITDGYFQAIPAFVECGLNGSAVGAENTASQGDFPWDGTFSLTGANTPSALTLELIDDTQAFEIEHVMFTMLSLSWTVPTDNSPAPVELKYSYFGRQLTPVTATSGQALPTIEFMNGKLMRFYKDTTWGGLGTTEIAKVRGGTIQIATGLHPKPFADANKYFATFGEDIVSTQITLDIEGDTDGDAILDEYQALTERAIRIDFNGSQIGTGDTHLFRVDAIGRWTEAIPRGKSIEGNNIHTCVFEAIDNETNYMDVDLVTDINTI